MKYNTLYIFSLSLFLLLGFGSCDKELICQVGNKSVERRQLFLEEINSVELQGSGNLYIRQGDEQKVEVETNRDLFSILNQHVDQGKWKIKFDKCVRKFSRFNVYLTVKDLNHLEVEGSGNVYGENIFSVQYLKLKVEGSGEIKMEVNISNLGSEINGSGDIILEGIAMDHSIEINGSGDVRARNLYSDKVDVEISGSGTALVNVKTQLDVDISGSGKVKYEGSPVIYTDISGSGRVERY